MGEIKKIGIFASGSGTNAENIIRHFKPHPHIHVHIVFTNKKKAYVGERAANHNVPVIHFNKELFYHSEYIHEIIQLNKLDMIVLAGFMWLFPKHIIEHFNSPIINIHPALLPKYGGKGMYGMKVHETVSENRDTETGISIHYVNEKYDDGALICQKKCSISPGENPEKIAEKVHELEYTYYPQVIEKLLMKNTQHQ